MINQHPKVSIVTPSYNQGQFIEGNIQSVLNQKYPNIEHIIIDGSSTDGTIDILKKYDHLKWISEPDNGQEDAINKGFNSATGEIIAWLNSDDYYCQGVFSQIANYFVNNIDIMWIYGNSYFVDKSGNVISYKRPVQFNNFVLKYGSFSIHQPTVFLKYQIFEEIGEIRKDFHAIMDQEWYCRIAEKYKPKYINLDVANFRWHYNSKSSSGKDSNHNKNLIRERKILMKRYANKLSPIIDTAPILTFICFNLVARFIKMYLRIKN